MANKKLKDVPHIRPDLLTRILTGEGSPTIGDLPQKGILGSHIAPRQARVQHKTSVRNFNRALKAEARQIMRLEKKWKNNRDPDDYDALQKAIQGFHNTFAREEERMNPEAGMKEPGDPIGTGRHPLMMGTVGRGSPPPSSRKRGGAAGSKAAKTKSIKKRKKKSKAFSGDDFVREVNNYKEM